MERVYWHISEGVRLHDSADADTKVCVGLWGYGICLYLQTDPAWLPVCI